MNDTTHDSARSGGMERRLAFRRDVRRGAWDGTRLTRFDRDASRVVWPDPVPYPTPAERDRSIATVLDAAAPQRFGLLSSTVDAIRSLGVRTLFFGVADCVFLGLVVTLIVWAPLFAAVLSAPSGRFGPALGTSQASSMVVSATVATASRPGLLLVPLFVAAPMLYESVAILTMLREHEAHMIELLRTCRWSFRRLAAVRMLALGALSTVVCVAFGACVALAGIRLDPVTTLGVSFSSLFLFALGQLGADRCVRWPASVAVVPIIWLSAGGVLWRFRDLVTPWLLRLPPIVCLAVGIALALAHAFALDARCRRRETRDLPLPVATPPTPTRWRSNPMTPIR